MEAWFSSRKAIRFPTLSNMLALDTEMGEAIISVLNISESLSIRDSYLEEGSWSVTDKMIGFMAMMKIPLNQWRMHNSGSLLSFSSMRHLRQFSNIQKI
jgi:hypothetical protein